MPNRANIFTHSEPAEICSHRRPLAGDPAAETGKLTPRVGHSRHAPIMAALDRATNGSILTALSNPSARSASNYCTVSPTIPGMQSGYALVRRGHPNPRPAGQATGSAHNAGCRENPPTQPHVTTAAVHRNTIARDMGRPRLPSSGRTAQGPAHATVEITASSVSSPAMSRAASSTQAPTDTFTGTLAVFGRGIELRIALSHNATHRPSGQPG
ncbi:MAG: hypothetical protein JWN03_3222 [Nocardia sp.]|nr:hypothetical protein [Nocardia sp.]